MVADGAPVAEVVVVGVLRPDRRSGREAVEHPAASAASGDHGDDPRADQMRSSTTTGITRSVLVSYSAKFGIAAACAAYSRSRSPRSTTVARAR